jgi:phosphate starvation-inducible PhoH-like protein
MNLRYSIVPWFALFLSKPAFSLKKGAKNVIKNPGSHSALYKPQTANQELYCHALHDPDYPLVLGVGPAGCGKTLFACTTAMEQLRQGTIKKIILTRPVVPVEEDIGYLPGTMESKMAPWTQPLFDVFHEYFSPSDIQGMVKNGVIEISPLAYMRGRTFKNAYVIVDEMQNSSPHQMLMLSTRIGDNVKMVITGDLQQSDRTHPGHNGLRDFVTRFKTATSSQKKGIQLVEFNATDVKRSAIVSQIIDMYESGPHTKDMSSAAASSSSLGFSDAAMMPPSHMIQKYKW